MNRSYHPFMSWLHRFWRECGRDERVALLVCTLWVFACAGYEYSSRRRAAPLPPFFVDAPRDPAGAAASSGAGASASEARFITVHVAGAVRRRGVQRLPAGTRLADAVRAAGGASSRGDINALNLAERLRDGQQIVVPEQGTQQSHLAGASSSSTANTGAVAARRRQAQAFVGTVNVNTATAVELEALPGIGPALAARIVAHRSAKGRFRTLQDLDEVKGLGPKKLQALRDHVTF